MRTKDKYSQLVEVDISLDKLVPKAGGNVFCLTRMAMLRALEIHAGSPPLVKFSPSEKETTIALREIAEGKIVWKGPDSKTRENLDSAKKDCV